MAMWAAGVALVSLAPLGFLVCLHRLSYCAESDVLLLCSRQSKVAVRYYGVGSLASIHFAVLV